MKKVSVCIPTYSRLGYLKQMVNCILNQTYNDYEICISQDITPHGVLPEIREYCEDLAKKHNGIVNYKAQKNNLGLAGNWNALVNMAQGKYIFIPGDDDLVEPDFLQKMLNTDTEDFDVIFCNQKFINTDGVYLKSVTDGLNRKYKRDVLDGGIVLNPVHVVLQNSIPMSAALIKKKWFSGIQFDNRINTPELEVFLKISLAGGRFYYIKEQLAHYRLHDGSATSNGLSIGQFLANIIDIKVPAEYEADKESLIKKAIVQGINNAIRNNNSSLAKKLYYSSYYFADKKIIRVLQKILIHLPNFISKLILSKFINKQ